ncbi:MAG TPA: right-handed parallel beta-helix repeat-containing protein [Jatrophihabitantaceae bacterium]|nr:right-handed parallel beta-helix repeat-containing protein [Jatrophihabitantaceae bacterium]
MLAAAAAIVAAGLASSQATTQSGATPAAARSCVSNVGGTGLSAAVVAHNGQRIADRTIATHCDIGIYVGSSAKHVRINGVTITGAHFQGILAENTSYLSVTNSVIRDNGLKTIDPKAPPLPGSGVRSRVGQAFGISLFGVAHVRIRGNHVTGNGRGGIGVMDNGANNPGALKQNPKAKLHGSNDVVIVQNSMSANYNGCAIVVATQNLGGHLSNMVIRNNTIRGVGMTKTGPDVGGIVVAADLPNSSVTDAIVSDNKVIRSFEGGVIVNSEAPGAHTNNVVVTGNQLRRNNFGKQEAPHTAGVVVFAAPAPGTANRLVVVAGNSMSGQFYGIWSSGANGLRAFGNHIAVIGHGVPVSRS